jgi:hypothetical protein
MHSNRTATKIKLGFTAHICPKFGVVIHKKSENILNSLSSIKSQLSLADNI